MRRVMFAVSVLWIGTGIVAAEDGPKIAVMETAFGNRAVVESVALAKQAGYAGVQIHTGTLGDDGVLTLARPEVIQAFKQARAKHQIEIVSLCAGEMNKYNSWQPESRGRALSIGLQSIRACQALEVPILLVPFFGNAQFGNDPEDPKFRAVADLFSELLPVAAERKVILALESPAKKPALDRILKELNHPNLKIYYDTGNMQGQGEDIYSVIEDWGPETICQIHLKPFESPSGIFAQGKTDIPRLARAIKKSGYREWFVFEAGRGKQARDVPFAAANRKGIDELCKEL